MNGRIRKGWFRAKFICCVLHSRIGKHSQNRVYSPSTLRSLYLINAVEHLARSVNDMNQTDLLILDFSKAFDKVAHKRLLLKLEYYGIRGLVLAWIKAWLIGRTQQLALEGEFSEKSCVRSGVPQGTVLGPLCFLLFVNDIERWWYYLKY